MNQLIRLSTSDFRLIFRDPSLRTFLVLPLLIFVVLLWAVPSLIRQYPVVEDYVLYVLMASITQVAQMFGFIYGLVFIDEKDTQVAKVYGVLPINKSNLVLSRLLIPFLFSILITWLIFLTQPFYKVAVFHSLILSFVIGLLSILYPITLSVLSQNKMEGLTWIKGLNIIIILPIVGYFLPQPYSKIFTVFPSYWIFEAVADLLQQGTLWLPMLVGFLFLIVLLFLIVRRFSKTHFS